MNTRAKTKTKVTGSPLLVISMGCPAGVGPEVAVAAAAAQRRARTVLVGDLHAVHEACRLRGVPQKRIVPVMGADDLQALRSGEIGCWVPSTQLRTAARPGKPRAADGAAQLAWIREAAALVAQGLGDALVTAPVSKQVIAESGAVGSKSFRGHTEYLESMLRSPRSVMCFWAPQLTTALATNHLALRDVPRKLRAEDVARACVQTATLLATIKLATLRSGKRGRAVKLAVCSLNPHAGEGGLLGKEEERIIAPGMVMAMKQWRGEVDLELCGPLGAESAYRLAHEGEFDGVVAMYHDQATIPSKLVAFGDAVNVTLGLQVVAGRSRPMPFIRTSVDHGTAYDCAGEGTADAAGMASALELARRLVCARLE